jgi:adenylate cyclase class 2
VSPLKPVFVVLEREVKLSFRSVDDARAALTRAGVSPLRSRRLQEDALFDTEDQWLRRRGCALRVRTESGRSLVTFKGPVQPGTLSTAAQAAKVEMKVREEHETVVGDGEILIQIFQALALRVWFRYQKYREEFAAEDLTISIDETPIGTFVEIEGGEAAILTMTRALGRTPADFILDSYYRLFMKHSEQFGLAADEMVFPV